MEAIDVIKNLFSACLIIISSLSYCYFISSKLPKGIFRLTSVIPIVCIFTLLPFYLCSAFVVFATSFSISWLCNFKLLLFAFDQGPLSCNRSKFSLPIFITIAAFPIIISQEKISPQKKTKFPLNLVVGALFFPLFAQFLINYRGILSPVVFIILYSIFTVLLIDILLYGSFWLGKSITGLELEQPSNEPLLSTSVQEFWGRRWNLVASSMLRSSICLPVRTASERVFGEGLCSTCVGVMACFLVSGLMHELLYYHMTVEATSWDVTLFFVMHGVVVSVEIVLKKKVEGKVRLNWFVSWILTIGFVSSTSWMVKFPQLIRSGVDVRLLEEYKLCVEYFKTKVLHVLRVRKNLWSY